MKLVVVLAWFALGCAGAGAGRPVEGVETAPARVAGPVVPAAVPETLMKGQRNPRPATVTLPARPNLALPTAAPGYVALRELQVRRDARFGIDVIDEGYVTWIYDCVAITQGRTKQSRARVVRSIEADPTQCRRPLFTIATAAPLLRYAPPQPPTAAAADPALGQACADAFAAGNPRSTYERCGAALKANPSPYYALTAALAA